MLLILLFFQNFFKPLIPNHIKPTLTPIPTILNFITFETKPIPVTIIVSTMIPNDTITNNGVNVSKVFLIIFSYILFFYLFSKL